MNIKTSLVLTLLLASSAYSIAQITNSQNDSIYIQQVEGSKGPDKVLHAEPHYGDLIRDLGAGKGEKEWNRGVGLTDNLPFESYEE